MNLFPSATSRTPDLYNLIRIHDEANIIETEILNARINGAREVILYDTNFTDTTIASNIEFDNTVTGNANFVTLTEVAVTPGNTLQYNSNQITFEVIVDGTVQWNDTDTTTVISTNGNLELGNAPTAAALTVTMTLDDVVTAINSIQSTTGISAEAKLDSGTGNYYLRLTKDNTVEVSTLIIDGTSTASILTDLGLTANTYVIDINDVASQIGSDGSVVLSGTYNIQIDNSNGVYIIGGTALSELGLTKSIDLSTNTIAINGHGLSNADQVSLTSPGDLPVPLNQFPNSYYYVIVVDANNFRLATTRLNALEGTAIDLTVDGDDYFTIHPTTDSEIYYQVWQGLSDNTVFKQRMDEVISHFEELQYTIFRQTNTTTNSTFNWIVRW